MFFQGQQVSKKYLRDVGSAYQKDCCRPPHNSWNRKCLLFLIVLNDKNKQVKWSTTMCNNNGIFITERYRFAPLFIHLFYFHLTCLAFNVQATWNSCFFQKESNQTTISISASTHRDYFFSEIYLRFVIRKLAIKSFNMRPGSRVSACSWSQRRKSKISKLRKPH